MISNYSKILLDFKSIPKHKRIKTFLEISGYPHYENVCSNILQFYLDPNNEHGLDDLCLNSLLKIIEPETKFDCEIVEVFRERPTIKDNRLDLLILTENHSIGIENKVFHFLNNDLEDYAKTIKSFCNESRKPINVILTLNKLTSVEDIKKVSSNNFINITYAQLFHTIKNSIGEYLTIENTRYVNHLLDFIKSIENLTTKTMENKELNIFFKNNSDILNELVDNFNGYKKSINQRVVQLQQFLSQKEYAPNVQRQWIFEGRCLVHDYVIKGEYQIAIDTYSNISGWEIQLFGRNPRSGEFLQSVMCNENGILTLPLASYERNERLVFQRFNADTDIQIVAKCLADLLNRIEAFKANIELNIVDIS
jgi:hypothetical protein